MADERVTFNLDGDADKLLKALSDSEGGFSDFFKLIVSSAVGAAKGLDTVSNSASKLADAKLLASANDYAKAITAMGGASKLTASEVGRANDILQSAIDIYGRMNVAAPEAIRNVATSLTEVTAASRDVAAEGKAAFDTLLGGLDEIQKKPALDELATQTVAAGEALKTFGGTAEEAASRTTGVADATNALLAQYQSLGIEAPASLVALQASLADAGTASEALGASTADAGTASTALAGSVGDASKAAGEMAGALTDAASGATDAGTAVTGAGEALAGAGAAAEEGAAKTKTLDEALRDVSNAADETTPKVLTFWETVGTVTAGIEANKILNTLKETIVSVFTAIPDMVTHVAELSKELEVMSQQTGVTTDALQGLRFIAQSTDTSFSGMGRAIQDLTRLLASTGAKAGELRERFADIGLSLEDLKNLPPDEAFIKILTTLGEMDDEGERNRQGLELLNRSWRQFSKLTGEDLEELIAKFKSMNITITKETIAAAKTYNDAQDQMKAATEGFENYIGSIFLPGIAAVATEMGTWGGAILYTGDALTTFAGKAFDGVASLATITSGFQSARDMIKGSEAGIKLWNTGLQSATTFAQSFNSMLGIATTATAAATVATEAATVASEVNTVAKTAEVIVVDAATVSYTALAVAMAASIGIVLAIVAGIAILVASVLKIRDAWNNMEKAFSEGKSFWEFFSATNNDNWARRLLGLSTAMDKVAQSAANVKAVKDQKDAFEGLAGAIDYTGVALKKLTPIQREQLDAALKAGVLTDAQISKKLELVGADELVVARARAAVTEQQKLTAQTTANAAAQAALGKVGLAAQQEANEVAHKAAVQALTDSDEYKKSAQKGNLLKALDTQFQISNNKLVVDSNKQAAADIRGLDIATQLQRINLEKSGLAASLASIDARRDADIKAAQAEGASLTKLKVIKDKAEADKTNAVGVITKQQAAQSEALAEEELETTIRLTRSGIDQQLSLLVAQAEEKKRLAVQSGLVGQNLIAEQNRIEQQLANQQNEILGAIANKAAEDILAIKFGAQKREIAITKTGMDESMALAEADYQESLRIAEKEGQLDVQKNVLLQKYMDERKKILASGDDVTTEGLQIKADNAKKAYDDAVKQGNVTAIEQLRLRQAAEEALAKSRGEAYEKSKTILIGEAALAKTSYDQTMKDTNATTEAKVKAAATLTEANAKAANSERQANLIRAQGARAEFDRVSKDVNATQQMKDDARKKSLDADLKAAKTQKDAAAITFNDEMLKLANMKTNREKFTDDVIAQQQSIVDSARAAADASAMAWTGSLDTSMQAFDLFASMAGGKLGGIANFLQQLQPAMQQAGQAGAGLGGAFGKGQALNFQKTENKVDKDGNQVLDSWGQPQMESGWSQASTGEKMAGAASGGMAVIQGVSAIKDATNVKGAGKRALGGAMAGAKVGMNPALMAATGGMSVVVGAGVGALVGALRHPDFEKVFKEVGTKYGVDISDALAKQISKDSKEKFGKNKTAAELFNLQDIIGEAGGLKDSNVGKFTDNFKDVFKMVDEGVMKADEGREVLEKNFGTFADQLVKGNKIASASFADIIKLNATSAAKSEEIVKFVTQQTARASDAITKMTAPMQMAAREIGALKVARDALESKGADTTLSDADAKELAADTLAIHEKMVKVMGAEATAQVEGLQSQKKLISSLEVQQAILSEKSPGSPALTAVNEQLDAARKGLDAMKESGNATFPAIDRAGRLMAATFNKARESGVDLLDAVDAMGPGLDELLQTYDDLGISIEGSAVSELASFRERINNNRTLVEGAGALNEVTMALSNIGALNVDTLKDLEAQGVETYGQLTEAGFSQNESLTMMKGFLENVIAKHKEMGIPIDEATQKLINQADAQGILSKEAMSSNDIMMAGFGAIIEAVGGRLPAAFQTFKDKAVLSAAGVTTALNDTAAKAANLKISAKPFDDWSERASAAARNVQDAVDGVSFGSSPGGLKEIPLKLHEAMLATEAYRKAAVRDFGHVKDVVDDIGSITQSAAPVVDGLDIQAIHDAQFAKQAADEAYQQHVSQVAHDDAARAAVDNSVTLHEGAIKIDRPILKDMASMRDLAVEISKQLKPALAAHGAW